MMTTYIIYIKYRDPVFPPCSLSMLPAAHLRLCPLGQEWRKALQNHLQDSGGRGGNSFSGSFNGKIICFYGPFFHSYVK